jgi:hypothetical protein
VRYPAFCVAPELDLALMRLGISFANDLFRGRIHLVMALSGENFGPCDDAEKSASALPPLAMSAVMHSAIPVDMTIVCIDIRAEILIESRKSHGQHPCRRT